MPKKKLVVTIILKKKKKKGLAAMSKHKRTEIAKKGGRSLSKTTHIRAGKRGGEMTKHLHGKEHFRKIGSAGGKRKKK